MVEHADLRRNLGAADNRDDRRPGIVHDATEHLELARHQLAGNRRQEMRDAFGGRMRTMRGAEGVVDVDVRECREPASERRIVRLLAGSKRTFSSIPTSPSRSEATMLWALSPTTSDASRTSVTEQAAQTRGDSTETEAVIDSSLRTAEVRNDDDARSASAQRLDGGERLANAAVVDDRTVTHRHVEILAQEHPFAMDVDVVHGRLVHATSP